MKLENEQSLGPLERRTIELEQERDRLRAANAALEERVKAQTAELEMANTHLDALAFFVSHELRSPLRAVDGFSAILSADHGAKLSPEGQRLISIIQRSAAKMSRLIDDVVRFGRVSRAALRKQRVDMRGLAKGVAEDLRAEWVGRKVEVSVMDLPVVTGDPALLREVLLSLISNAAKFGQKRDPARIEVGARTEGAEQIFWVKDNGAGFDMRHATRLFRLFERLHGEHEFTGTGVGLGMVHAIVRRHGGRVWAEGVPEQGATFYFSLPAG